MCVYILLVYVIEIEIFLHYFDDLYHYIYTLEARNIQLCFLQTLRELAIDSVGINILKLKFIPLAVLPLSDVKYQPLPLHVRKKNIRY